MIFPGTPGRFSDCNHALCSNVGKGPKGDGIIADVVRDDPYGVYRIQFKNSKTGEVYLTTPNMDPGSRIYFCMEELTYESDDSYVVPFSVFSPQQAGTIRDARVGDIVFYKLHKAETSGTNAIGIGIITNISLQDQVTFMQHAVLDVGNIDEIDARIQALQEAADAIQETIDTLPSYEEFTTLKSHEQRLIYVDDYGADPTGVNDSSSAFQAAINDAVAGNSLSIYVGSGFYRIDNTITVNGGLSIIGSVGKYPQEFSSNTTSTNSLLQCNAEITFIVEGYNMGGYTFAPIYMKNVTFAAPTTTSRELTFIQYHARGGSSRPSFIESCEFLRFDKVFEFVTDSSAYQLDGCTMLSCIFRNNNYVAYGSTSGFGSVQFLGCVFDSSLGFDVKNVFGCYRFQGCLLEQAVDTPRSIFEIQLRKDASVVIEGCYIENIHVDMHIVGTLDASRLLSTFVFSNNGKIHTTDFNLNIELCYVDIQRAYSYGKILLNTCVLNRLLDTSPSYGSIICCLCTYTPRPVENNASSAIQALTISGIPVYSRANLGTCYFNVVNEGRVVLYGMKQRISQTFTVTNVDTNESFTVQMPYERGCWIHVTENTLPAGRYSITNIAGSVPNMVMLTNGIFDDIGAI